MAEKLVSGILNGEIDHSIVLESLQNDTAIQINDFVVPLSEFIPYVLTYLREKLTVVQDSTVYYSPRQIEEKKKITDHNKKRNDTNSSRKSARISLQYSSSSPAKKYSNTKKDSAGINGISPIKTHRKTPPYRKTTTNFISPPADNSNASSSVFELSSFDDFPTMSLTPSNKNPRRITATPVGKAVLSSSKTETADAFFLEESTFETQNTDASFNQLFVDNERFTKATFNTNTNNDHFDDIANGFDVSFSDAAPLVKVIKSQLKTPTKDVDVFQKDVDDCELLNVFVEIYSCICLQNLVPNITLELYFIFVTLTYPSNLKQNMKYSYPFSNLSCCVYFAAKCLEKLFILVGILDVKTMQILVDNPRLKNFTSTEFHKRLQEHINNDLSEHFKGSLQIKSPMTGIPFQVDSDNRKTFITDKHFYSFSKKRDAFYALVREWQENHIDPDWNMKLFMLQKVPEIMKSSDGINIHYQFAKLFVAQLLEMCRNSVGSKADEPNTSDSVLLELKKSNPSKFQNLQDRLTRPSISHDLCPKPSFSMVEEFFKEFIAIADGYCFTKFLIHVLLSYILDINSRSFGLDAQVNVQLNQSDFADSLWEDIKIAIAELRLLAKFLGYIIFLPYHSAGQYGEDSIFESRYLVNENLNLVEHLNTSFKKHRLLITVPWVVDFFSMADKHAFKQDIYSKPLQYLALLITDHVMKLTRKGFSVWSFALIQHIGWLLEQPCVQNICIYENAISVNILKPNEIECITGIDDIVIVDKQFLYDLCPYLNDIKKPLLDFNKGTGSHSSSGTLRKITPVRTSDAFSIDIDYNVKVQLMDSFMKYLPNHVQECIKFLTDRHVMNVKHHISSTIIDLVCQKVFEDVTEKFNSNSCNEVTLESLKLKNLTTYSKYLKVGKNNVECKSHEYLKSYLNERILASVENLLPDATHSKVIEVSAKVVKHNVRLKVQEWMAANRDVYTNGVDLLYNRFIKTHIKNMNKH